MRERGESRMKQARLEQVYNLLNVNNMLLESILKRDQEQNILNEHERDLLIVVNAIKERLKSERA
jgi:hypothetical protein